MSNGWVVVAYHGCDITTRDGLVSGLTSPRSSANKYDWLGPGFYFFEGDPERALAFATTASKEPSKRYTAAPIVEPAVVGCVFIVQRCLDMTTRIGLLEFEQALAQLRAGLRATGAPIPRNTSAGSDDTDGLLRRLDNAVFNFIHEARDPAQSSQESAFAPHYQMVRGAFRQGQALAAQSGFHRDSHIQIALRDLTCIQGWFLRPGDQLMGTEKNAQANAAMETAVNRYEKPRQVLAT